jgi:hypothetical protein
VKFIIGGGRPGFVKETYMIKDGEGYVMSTKEYIRGNPELFKYIGHVRINSTIVHTFEFLPDR